MLNEIMQSCKYLVLTAMVASFLSREGMVVRALSSAVIFGFRTLLS